MAKKRLYQVGEYWIGREPNRPNFYAYWYDSRTGKGSRKTLRTRDIEQAKTILHRWGLEDTRTSKTSPQDCDLRIVLIDYYKNYGIELVAASTIKAAIESIISFMEQYERGRSLRVSDLTPERIEKYKKQDLSPNTLHTYLKYLRAALSRAVKMGKLDKAPHIETFKKFELNGPRKAYITPDMMAEALTYADGHLYRFFILGIGTIARTNTVLDYHVPTQTDFDNRLMDLNQPGRRQTTKHRPVIGLNDFMAETLKDEKGYFVSYRGDRIQRIGKAFNNMKHDLGWPQEIVAKTIRHSVAKTIRNRKEWKVNPWELAGHMGHIAVEMTETYAQYEPDPDGTVAKAICKYASELERNCGFTLTKLPQIGRSDWI